jgi:hypothetical protein
MRPPIVRPPRLRVKPRAPSDRADTAGRPPGEASALDAYIAARGKPRGKARDVLRAIDAHARGPKATAFPSNATIALKAGCSERHARRLIQFLCRLGALARYPCPSDGSGREFYLPWKADTPPDAGGQRTDDHTGAEGEGGGH